MHFYFYYFMCGAKVNLLKNKANNKKKQKK